MPDRILPHRWHQLLLRADAPSLPLGGTSVPNGVERWRLLGECLARRSLDEGPVTEGPPMKS